MNDRIETMRSYAESLERTAASYVTAASAPGLPGGWDGRAGSYLRGEADRLNREAVTVRNIVTEWEDNR